MRCNHIHRRNNRCYRPRQWVPPQPYVYMDSVGEVSAQVWPFSPHTQTSSSEFIIPYSPSNADNPLWEIATDTSDITIASMIIDWASDGEISFTINAWEEWTATLSYWAVNNPEDIKTIEVTVWTPTPVTPIPNNNILIEPTRWDAIVKFFAIDETSEDYVEASVGWVELENISYHWACEWNEYCQGMFSNRTLVRNLGRALSEYIDDYWIPEDWVLYFTEDVYDSVEDYFAWEITAAQLGRNIRDAEQAIVPEDPSSPFAITSVDTDSTSVTVWTSEQFWLNYTPGSANPKKHIIITSTDDSIATAHIDDYYPNWRARILFDWIGAWVATVTLSDWVNNYDVEVTVELPCDDPCNPECPNYDPCVCDPCSRDCPDRDPCECDWGCISIAWVDFDENTGQVTVYFKWIPAEMPIIADICDVEDWAPCASMEVVYDYEYSADVNHFAYWEVPYAWTFFIQLRDEASSFVDNSDDFSFDPLQPCDITLNGLTLDWEPVSEYELSVWDEGTVDFDISYDCANPDFGSLTVVNGDVDILDVNDAETCVSFIWLAVGSTTITVTDVFQNEYVLNVTVTPNCEDPCSDPSCPDYDECMCEEHPECENATIVEIDTSDINLDPETNEVFIPFSTTCDVCEALESLNWSISSSEPNRVSCEVLDAFDPEHPHTVHIWELGEDCDETVTLNDGVNEYVWNVNVSGEGQLDYAD